MNPNPLSKTDLNTARTGVYDCRVAQEECARCKACGLDVTEQEARIAHLMGYFQQVPDNYQQQQSGQPS